MSPSEALWKVFQRITRWPPQASAPRPTTGPVSTPLCRTPLLELRARYLTNLRTARKTRLPQDDDEPDDEQLPTERSWKERLLEQLMSMAPDAFERLAKRLLREADFDSVNVTGKSGDGGIDGLGVYRLGLVSFPVFFQCKRDGAPPIDLIDGDRLCELLKRYDLGVRTTTRTVEDVGIDDAFFAEI
jgi:restriction system protein